jgi:HEAT repeat protein
MSDNGRKETPLTPEERIEYIETLIEIGYDNPAIDHTPVLVEFLEDEDADVRAMAVEALWHYPDPDLIDRLIQIADNDPDPHVRGKAVSGLGIYVYQGEMADYDYDFGPMNDVLREDELPEADFIRVKDYLLGVYRDETRTLDERRFALEALAFLSDPEIAGMIEAAYNSPQREMKISAIFGMGRSGLVRWTDILARELYNADQDIQREAIRAVGEVGLTELGQDVWQLTYTDDRDIQMEAIEALGQTGWEGAFERLEELTLDPDEEVAEVASDALDEWLWISEMLRKAGQVDEGWEESEEDGNEEDWDADQDSW